MSCECTAPLLLFCFSFPAPPTAAISTLSLHDALPICAGRSPPLERAEARPLPAGARPVAHPPEEVALRSEEHTSELQSRGHLVCRLLLEKKKKRTDPNRRLNQHHSRTLLSSRYAHDSP